MINFLKAKYRTGVHSLTRRSRARSKRSQQRQSVSAARKATAVSAARNYVKHMDTAAASDQTGWKSRAGSFSFIFHRSLWR